ncbi:MAG TPA: hypothetical protein VF705_09305 [Longimicrobium sp.]|jgi:hypothetical protein
MTFAAPQILPANFSSARGLAAGFAAAAILAGCDQPDAGISGPTVAPPNLQRHVTGDAAASLNAQGMFTLAAPAAPDARPIISAERAGELALASVRSWGPSLRAGWEKERGQSIDLENLRVGGRVLFARTPYGQFPGGYHPALARAYGPYYLVTLYSGAHPALLISVAAYNGETRINQRGLVDRPVLSGMEFISRALPLDTTRFRLISPEEAVEYVGRTTGARAAATPELVRLSMPNAPESAAWRITLDRELPVQARTGAARVRHIYVSPERDRRLMAAVGAKPRVERTSGIVVLPVGHRIEPVDVPVVDGEVIAVEPITPDAGGK